MSENPFDRYDLDPLSDAGELTERFRDLAADAEGTEADAIRAAWEDLTLHVRRRVVAALTTFVDEEPRAMISPPPLPARAAAFTAPRGPALPRLVDPPRGAAATSLDPVNSIAEDPLLDEGSP